MEVKELGYSFYLEHVPEDEQKMLVELNSSGFKFFETFDIVDKYKCSMSYHFHLNSGTKRKLINHQLTPILLTDEGKIWIGMCVVSLSSHKTAGHVVVYIKVVKQNIGNILLKDIDGKSVRELS